MIIYVLWGPLFYKSGPASNSYIANSAAERERLLEFRPDTEIIEIKNALSTDIS